MMKNWKIMSGRLQTCRKERKFQIPERKMNGEKHSAEDVYKRQIKALYISKTPMTIAEISKKFSVSKVTVYEDI